MIKDKTYYRYNYENIPDRLSDEEQTRLLNLLANGDQSVKSILIEHNLKLVIYMVKKYEYLPIDKEDLVSIGTIGLVKGVNTFKPDKNVKLATYCSICIDNEIKMYLRKFGKLKIVFSLDEPLMTDKNGNDLLLSNVLGVNDNSDVVEDKVMVEKALAILSDDERHILKLRFEEDKTQTEVAKILDVSQSWLSRLEKNIFKKLKNVCRV